jgi:hypothetical protein
MKKKVTPMKSETLDADERSALVIGLRSEESDQDVSLEEALDFARNQRKQWTNTKSLSTP